MLQLNKDKSLNIKSYKFSLDCYVFPFYINTINDSMIFNHHLLSNDKDIISRIETIFPNQMYCIEKITNNFAPILDMERLIEELSEILSNSNDYYGKEILNFYHNNHLPILTVNNELSFNRIDLIYYLDFTYSFSYRYEISINCRHEYNSNIKDLDYIGNKDDDKIIIKHKNSIKVLTSYDINKDMDFINIILRLK